METNTCYCCGNENATHIPIRQGLWVWLCETCKGARITRRGFECPAHGIQEPIDVAQVRYPDRIAYTRDEKREWLLFYDECLPEKQ